MWLVKNGIPFDVAFQLDDVARGAFSIVFSEMEGGGEFDWHTMSFKEQK